MLMPWQYAYDELHLMKNGKWKQASVPFSEFFKLVKVYEVVHPLLVNENLKVTFTRRLRYRSWKDWLPISWRTVSETVMIVTCSKTFGYLDDDDIVHLTTRWEIILDPVDMRNVPILIDTPLPLHWVKVIRDGMVIPVKAEFDDFHKN